MQSNKPPRVNWPHHENAVQGSSSRDAFLRSSFLFSLPTQRPNPEAPESMLSLRYVCLWFMGTNLAVAFTETAWIPQTLLFCRSSACKIHGPERLHAPLIEKVRLLYCYKLRIFG